MPEVRSIVRDAAASKYKFSSLVMSIVKSDAFRMNMKAPAAPGAAGSPLRGRSTMFVTQKAHLPSDTLARRLSNSGAAVAGHDDSCEHCDRTDGGGAKPRFVGCFVPHGMAPGYWIPEKEGALPASLPFNFKPLEHVPR